MTPTNKDLLAAIKSVRLDLASMGGRDTDRIARVGAEIERLLTEHEADLAPSAGVLHGCLRVLEKLFVDDGADAKDLIASVETGLVATEHCIASGHSSISLEMANQALLILERTEGPGIELSVERPEALSSAVEAVGRLRAGDLDSLVQAGAAIERVVTAYPAVLAEGVEHLSTCLEALQYAYQNEWVDAVEVFAKVSEVVLTVAAGEPGSADGAASALRDLIGLANGNESSQISVPETLDEVGSILMQVSPDDHDELGVIAEALKRISDKTENAKHRKLIVKSARALAKAVKGKKDAGAAISELCETIETIGSDTLTSMTQAASRPPAIELVEESVEPVAEAPRPQASIPLDQDDGLLAEFIVESGELIEAAEQSLLALENDPEDIESINTVFRAFHSVKGTSAFLGLKEMTDFAHLAESLLSRMRDREIRCAGGYADLAFRSVDVIKEMLRMLGDALPGRPDTLPASYAELFDILKDPEANGISGDASVAAAAPSVTAARPETAEAAEAPRSNAGESSVRVRTDRLDSLIDMIGELVIAQSMLAQDHTVLQGINPELSRKISHAGKIVRELQDLSMSMRMVPLKNTFQKMTRIVRDVAKKCGKTVDFVTEGDETEVDRNMVDIIADPLVHMVRNAVDHGIETPEKRSASGKERAGSVKLSAYHASGDVVVELSDDGAGLDRDRIAAKAIANGLIESDAGMSDGEIYRLIFAPGFSTADEVTDVSGRGVGMDVVRRNIEGMRGRISISSKKGQGSVFTIRLPLTLAITDGMLVRVGKERFIVPTINIQLTLQPNREMLSTVAGRGELVNLRGEFLRVFRLHEIFGIKGAVENPTEALLMIIADGRRRCALLVDELLGQHQVVTKSLGDGIGKVNGVSGGAILGDGCVGLILDTAELVSLSRNDSGPKNRRNEHLRLAA